MVYPSSQQHDVLLTRPTSNQAQCRATTMLFKTNVLDTITCHHWDHHYQF